jgi:diacylglycerol kinase family enzyme
LVNELAKLLEEQERDVAIMNELPAMAAAVQAELTSAADPPVVIAAGGDGTLNALVNLLPEGVPILTLPLGTENLLAKYLGVLARPEQIVELLCDGWTFAFDAGRAGERLFLLMFSCGLDADVVHRMHAVRRGPISHWSYLKPLWEALRRYHYPEFQVHVRYPSAPKGETDYAKGVDVWGARWAFVSNLPCYAGQLRVAPNAVGDDGLLDLCVFQGASFGNALRYLIGVFFGSHARMPDCRISQVRRIELASDEPVPFQVDGDPGGCLPVAIEVVPRRFRAVVPRLWLTRQGWQ